MKVVSVVAFSLILITAGILSNGAAVAGQPAAAVTVTPAVGPMLYVTANAVVQAWPIDDSDVLGALPARSTVPTDGRTDDSLWWRIPYPGAPEGSAWVSASVVQPNAAAATVTVYTVIYPTPGPTPVPPTPEPPAACSYNAAFVADVTIPDGTVIGPAQPINKVWRLRNSGTCAWDAGTVLTFVSGFQMSAAPAAAVPPTAAGATADIGVTLYAPAAPGSYRGIWQLKNGLGQLFGPQVTVVVQVPNPAPPPPTPAPTPFPNVNFWSDTDRVNAGQCTTIHWNVSGVNAVYLDYGGKSRGVVGQGSQGVCPSNDGKTYTLRVQRYDGNWDNRTLVININNPPPPPNPEINFYSDKQTVTIGTCTNVHWSVRNASRVQYDQGNGRYIDVEFSGQRRVCPAYPTTYRLRVTDNQNGVHDRSVLIRTAMPPPGILTPVPGKLKK